MQRPVVIVPGIGGSGPDHWQSLWQAELPDARRIDPASWDRPDLDDWVAAIDRAVAASTAPPVLVAHSLGCLAVVHWAGRAAAAGLIAEADAAASADAAAPADAASPTGPAAGAFLVAPPDVRGPEFPASATSFIGDASAPLSIPAVLVASSDDPYCTLAHAAELAAAWNVPRIDIGAHGHVNVASGFGPWPEGRRLLDAFGESLARAA